MPNELHDHLDAVMHAAEQLGEALDSGDNDEWSKGRNWRLRDLATEIRDLMEYLKRNAP